ncbi:MAG: tyrosine-type recombinase/integrase [Gaiellaceae bacterium]
MSVHRRVHPSGKVAWRVRWREGSVQRSHDFARKSDADAFDVDVRRRAQLGDLEMLEAGKQKLADLAREWWSTYAEPNLARKTLVMYASLWDRYVLPRLGGLELRRLSPAVIEGFQAELRREGVGDPTIIKTLTLLQGMLQRAVVWGRIPSNPVAPIRKPSQRRARAVQPISPATVEEIRGALLARGRLRDATLVSVLAYAGLRPGEALALRWGDIGERTILVDRAVSLGDVKGTKTGKRRSVRLLAPLVADLAEWRLGCGRPDDDAIVFPTSDGRVWTESHWRNWRQRVFAPAASSAGLQHFRPYDLRHSFVSLLFAEGRTVIEVARQAGHSPAMALATYGHVIEELEGAERRTAEDVIREARGTSGQSVAVTG